MWNNCPHSYLIDLVSRVGRVLGHFQLLEHEIYALNHSHRLCCTHDHKGISLVQLPILTNIGVLQS